MNALSAIITFLKRCQQMQDTMKYKHLKIVDFNIVFDVDDNKNFMKTINEDTTELNAKMQINADNKVAVNINAENISETIQKLNAFFKILDVKSMKYKHLKISDFNIDFDVDDNLRFMQLIYEDISELNARMQVNADNKVAVNINAENIPDMLRKLNTFFKILEVLS